MADLNSGVQSLDLVGPLDSGLDPLGLWPSWTLDHLGPGQLGLGLGLVPGPFGLSQQNAFDRVACIQLFPQEHVRRASCVVLRVQASHVASWFP